jgi:O-antigen/teichoic acid export membrane protein
MSMRVSLEIARDSIYSLVMNVAPRLSSALFFILIGRLAGPERSGVFSLAATYLLVLTAVMRGLDDLLIRQVSRAPERASEYLTSFLGLRVALSVGLYGLSAVLVERVLRYNATTTLTILILCLSVLPDGLAYVAQSVLQGQRRFALPAFVWLATSALKLAGGGWLLTRGELTSVAWLWVVVSFLGMAAMVWAAHPDTRLRSPSFYWQNLRALAWRTAVTFLLITIVVTVEFQGDVILLSLFSPVKAVSWYFAATTVTAGLMIISQAYWSSAYPVMTRYAAQSDDKVIQFYRRSMGFLGLFIIPAAFGLALMAPAIVTLLFGSGFGPTAQVLRLLSVALVPFFFNEVNTRIMLVKDRQSRLLRFLLVSASANILLNLLFIPALAERGAALARIGSCLTYFLLSYGYARQFLSPVDFLKLVGKPVLAACAMAGIVFFVRDWFILIPVLIGIVIYVLLLWLFRDESASHLFSIVEGVFTRYRKILFLSR